MIAKVFNALIVVLVMSCFGCASRYSKQLRSDFPRDENGYPVARISGSEFYKVVDYASTNRLAMQAAINKLLIQNEQQHIIVIESFFYGGFTGDLKYEWAVITDHDQGDSVQKPYRDGGTFCAKKELVDLICEQVLEAPRAQTISEPALSERNCFVAFSIYNGVNWKQEIAINPWHVFSFLQLSMEREEKTVAMRLTFALLAAFQVEGLPERLKGTYVKLHETFRNNISGELTGPKGE